jgi:iron-sulfur cluster repair protein YtfE (RIC family)
VSLVPLKTSEPTGQRSDDPVDLLIDCHQRLRLFTTLAVQLAAQPAARPSEVSEVAGKVHRYFTVALPLHEEDEEQSVFPRLLEAAPELASTVARLREAHEAHAVRVGALVALCQELHTWPERFSSLRVDLNEAAWALEEIWRVHLTLEEAELFPALRTALTAEETSAIRDEMRARRARLPPR